MRFSKLVPMLHTQDMDKTIQWYVDILGFELRERSGDDWCSLVRGDAAIMFMQNDHFGTPEATATQYFYVDDVPALWESLKDDVTAEWGPEIFDYGMLEFAIRDPNGYLLSFGQPVD